MSKILLSFVLQVFFKLPSLSCIVINESLYNSEEVVLDSTPADIDYTPHVLSLPE